MKRIFPALIFPTMMLAAILVPVAGAPVHAQTAPTASQTMTPAARVDQVEARIASLHTRLKITTEQEAQWAAFTTVMRANAKQMGELYQTGNPQTMSAVEAMRHYAKISQAHAEEIDNLVIPFEALYNMMAPAQKKAADDAFHTVGRNGRPHI